MSIQAELTRITNAKAAIKTAIEGKGITVPDGTLLDGMAALIESIEAGGGGEETMFGTYFETGSIIPASDITANYTIQFQKNFSSILNRNDPRYTFVLWCSIPPGYTRVEIPNNSLAWVFWGRKKENGSIVYGQYLSSSGSKNNLTYSGEIGENGLDSFTLYCTKSKKLVAGYVYNWIALAPSSEGYTT